MRITLSGDLGSGKSSVGRRLAEKLGVPHYSAGTLFREIGQISNLDALQTNLAAENNVGIDFAVDERTRELDRRIESFIIDSRMAWHFVSRATRVYLSVSPETAAKRIASDRSRSTESYESLAIALASLEKRRDSEVRRYKNLYAADITDPANYDLIVITDDAEIDDIAEVVINFAKGRSREKFWMPKRRLVPMVGVREASGSGPPFRPSLSDDFWLSLSVGGNFGFFFGETAQLVSAFRYELPIIPYRPNEPESGKVDVCQIAKRTLSKAALHDWEEAFAVRLSFAECLDS
jgi:predicted cytidylate kinase